MDSRITKTTVFKTPDSKAFETEEDAVLHLAGTDHAEIIEEFVSWFGDRNEYSEKHRAAVRNALRAFVGWQKLRGYETSDLDSEGPHIPPEDLRGTEPL